MIDRRVAADPGREALVGRSGRFTFAELDRAANRSANALAALGVEAGERVAACLPNDVHLPILFLATQGLGALWVGVNRLLAPPEKAYLLRDSGARVYVTLAALAAEIEAQPELPELAHVVRVAPGAADCAWARRCAAASEARPAFEQDPFAPAAIARQGEPQAPRPPRSPWPSPSPADLVREGDTEGGVARAAHRVAENKAIVEVREERRKTGAGVRLYTPYFQE